MSAYLASLVCDSKQDGCSDLGQKALDGSAQQQHLATHPVNLHQQSTKGILLFLRIPSTSPHHPQYQIDNGIGKLQLK